MKSLVVYYSRTNITEKLAKSVMGGTGRNEAEQAEIEARADYNDEAYRITIASSKSISPGYQVTSLVLTDFAKMNFPSCINKRFSKLFCPFRRLLKNMVSKALRRFLTYSG